MRDVGKGSESTMHDQAHQNIDRGSREFHGSQEKDDFENGMHR
jgi:hypothetical protein